MFLVKLVVWSCVFTLAQLVHAESALAWGPAVHTVIALNMIEDVRLILPSIAAIISAFPIEYIYGCLAADFFVGKSRMKKAAEAHNWTGGFQFLNEANDDRDAAYAYGFLSHLAADVIAHHLFVPSMTSDNRAWRKKRHFYWEMRADYLMGQKYTKIARDVLKMNHSGCDDLLANLSGEKINGLKAKKMLYTQSVKFSDRAYTTHHLFFPEGMGASHSFEEFASFMVGLASQMVKGFLLYPETAPCLGHDPLGLQGHALVKKRGLDRFFRNRNTPRASVMSDYAGG
jgi:hypothetical protein